ncbi:MAG: ATP-binding protein [Cyanobacteriota bacterium]|nr:ATP-binding protein [Cyanobacteriota bacterium]
MSNASLNPVKNTNLYSSKDVVIQKGIFSKIKNSFSRLSIRRKISYGYCLAIGVGITGTTLGLLVGDYHQEKALSELRISDKQKSTIVEIESALTNIEAYPQQLIKLLGDPISLDYERNKFIENLNRIERKIRKFETFCEHFPSHIAINEQDINFLEAAYEDTITNYVVWVDSWESELNITNISAEEIPETQKEIWNRTRAETATQISQEFERVSEYLTQLIAKAEAQREYSTEHFNQANLLRFYLIFSSMFLSTLIAVLFSILTSHAIANPVQRLTQVAQDMTEDTNLSLRASVNSQDEVGRLAKSLNQLIEWVETYTYELNQARQTLEDRVDERTQELQQTLQELRTTQAQLIHTEKMSSLGQTVAGVAHEINNPINFIYANLPYIRRYLDDIFNLIEAYKTECQNPSESLQDLIEETELEFLRNDLSSILTSMETGSDRIRDIVLSLRTFSRLDESETKSVDLHAGIDSTLMLLKPRLERHKSLPEIQVICNYGKLSKVNCNASHINQVFMNIFNNAIDALRAKTFTEQEPTLEITTQMTSENMAQIAIADNGGGIEPKILERIFEPFFTTKPVGSGTGLGLSTSYQIIVDKHKGRLSCTSSLGEGTTFVIEIPTTSVTYQKIASKV